MSGVESLILIVRFEVISSSRVSRESGIDIDSWVTRIGIFHFFTYLGRVYTGTWPFSLFACPVRLFRTLVPKPPSMFA